MEGFDFEEVKLEATQASLNDVGVLVEKMMGMQDEIDALEDTLKRRKEELRHLQENELVNTMDSAGCSEFKFKDGRKVGVRDSINVSIPKGNEDDAYKWFRDEGHGDLIKRELKMAFGRGEDDVADQVKKDVWDLFELGMSDKASIHAATLKAFCKEQLEKGVELPAKLLGLYVVRRAEIIKK